MNRYIRILAISLVLLLLCSACGGGKLSSRPDTVAIVTSRPDTTDEPMQPPFTPLPELSATELFHALDREVFLRYITMDGYSYHQMLAEPSAFGLDSESLRMYWGEFTEEDSEAYGLECAAYLARLLEIPRAELNERDQLSYDILQQYLEDASAENIFAYHYEPLTAYNGLHTTIPLALGLFKFKDEQDVKDYLALLEDVPRYLGQVLAYEQKRAELGLFMSEKALNEILSACKDIINARDNFYLIGTFNDAVDDLSGLGSDAAASYKAHNASVVSGVFIDAYQSLYDGLAALRGSCKEHTGLSALGEKGLAYFAYGLQAEGDNRLSVEETLELLKEELFYEIATYFEIYEKNPNLIGQSIQLTSGSVQEDLKLLDSLTKQLLFELPAHEIKASDIPEELERQMSGAAYVIPPIDDWADNEILINRAYTDNEQLMTLAHEVYPGHLFQYVYQRSLSDTGLMQRALHYGAYAEGWSQTATYLIARTQTAYDTAYSELRFYNDMIVGVLLPGIVSIYVNYYGYSEDGVRSFISDLGLALSGNVQYYYDLAVEQPFYIFNYATGYCQLAKLMRDAEESIGEAYDQRAFLKAYLDLGPGYFNLIQERMDVWIDENTPE